jgi:hypothetical protein
MQQDLLSQSPFQYMLLQQVFLQAHLEHAVMGSLISPYALKPYIFARFCQDISIHSNFTLCNSVLDQDPQDM